jgi:acyl-CoA reductase-like NAD-dependent aldehyde dehydrogenase
MASTDTAARRLAPDKLHIDGQWVDAADGARFQTWNPGTGELLTEVAEARPGDVDRAVAAARAAFAPGSPWRTMDALDRGELIAALGRAVAGRVEELAELETLDNGKPIREARIDINQAVDAFRYYAGWASKLEGETIPVRTRVLNYTLREPVGVVGAIIPWNFPLLMAAWKLAPALACGNTVVLKPAEQTPLTALELAALAVEVGFPPGVINIVPGFGETAGAALVAHPEVDKIAFTGSTEVGKLIMREAAGTLKRVSLELGGKSPNIVFEDADVEAALRGAFNGIFYNSGQCCTAGSRLLVQESIRGEFMDALVERVSKLQPGEPLEPKRRYGPVISEAQLERVLHYIERGREEGATLRAGGKRVEGAGAGYWVEPTIFDQVSPDATIAREEIFGPVLAAMSFEDEEEAVELANRTIYGLAAAIWTSDVKRAHRVASRIEAGTIWVNTYHPLDTASPFGGYKQSGHGRELGKHALELYTQVKSVWVDLH